jgi:hypothetical protein
MTTTTGSLPIVCCFASARAAVAAATVVAAAAAVVNNAKPLIVAIEREGSKLSFNALGQCDSAVQAYGLRHACWALLVERVGDNTPLCLLPELTKRQCINQFQQQGTKKLLAGGGSDG